MFTQKKTQPVYFVYSNLGRLPFKCLEDNNPDMSNIFVRQINFILAIQVHLRGTTGSVTTTRKQVK